MLALLKTFSWQELLHHPWRNASAVVAVMLGVALALAVHLINASALSEFSGAVRSVNGQPDLELRARQGLLDDALLERVAAQPGVNIASPVLDLPTTARAGDAAANHTAAGAAADVAATNNATAGDPVKLRLVGVDALSVAGVSPALMPRGDASRAGARRLDLFAPDAVYLNPAARLALGESDTVAVQAGLSFVTLRVAGTVNAPGAPLLVMDIAAAQDLMARAGQLSRIDLRLSPGTDADALLAALALPPSVFAQRPEQAGERVSNLSRAYRVNLTVLALVALFTGAFLVFSVLSLSVARRTQQFALLGALGSALGVALGTALAALALGLLGGDLGGGYFSGEAPPLQWSWGAALLYGALGTAAAVVGGWWPARAVAGMAPALALKGLGAPAPPSARRHTLALGLMALAAALAWAPPVGGLPLAAYFSVGLLLVGGIAALPLAVGWLLNWLAPLVSTRALPMLAVERSRRLRETAAVATSGVVASLALSVALTVMVASFRDSVTQWLDGVLPAQLYVRGAAGGSAEGATLPPDVVRAIETTPGVARADPLRTTALQLSSTLPAVTLLSRPLRTDSDAGGTALPLVGNAVPLPAAAPGERVVPVYVSEAMVDLYDAQPGGWLPELGLAFAQPPAGTRFFIVGVWRDYARQHGSVVMDRADFVRLSGDDRVNDLALTLTEGSDENTVRDALRARATELGVAEVLEFASASQIRAISLRIFDRSFAVTYWLQAVAIGIGLFGVAASFSAQVLARQREFGLLAHLGLTRQQILGVVALEGLAWTVLGAIAGLALGLAVSLVLVHVVNPQSFHWTMDLALPWLRLLALCVAVVLAGTLTAWLAGRAAAGRDAVQAVKQDW